jgi:hypothetical protein
VRIIDFAPIANAHHFLDDVITLLQTNDKLLMGFNAPGGCLKEVQGRRKVIDGH